MFSHFVLSFVILCITICGNLADPICPPTNQSGETVYYARDSDCNRYYKCEDGSRTALQCSPNQFFDIELEKCEYNKRVDCTPSTIICPFGSKIVYYAHADCTKYYLCYSGISIEYTCPQNKLYDTQTQICVPEEQINCAA